MSTAKDKMAAKSIRHRIEGKEGPLFWYSVGEHVAVFPFTRSRMNRKTLGCYGRSARTSPLRTFWMWGVTYIDTKGLPMTWDATLQSFSGPQYDRAHDLKAAALVMARDMAEQLAEFGN